MKRENQIKNSVDAIIKYGGGIVLIERRDPPFGIAIPGGHVEYGETLEEAVRREMWEETGLELENLRQFHTYSDPDRDPRCQMISTVFIADGIGIMRPGYDAINTIIITEDEISRYRERLAFDHYDILMDYVEKIWK